MAAKKQSTAVAKTTASTSLATIDQELNNEVALLKDMIGQSAGNKLSLEATGDFITPDGMNLGNEIQIVVVDFASRNNLYLTPYNAQNVAPPDCYAIGRVIRDMAPEDDSPSPQADSCLACPMNQFGSGNNGKSKACQNRRLLAVLIVDPDNPDAHNELDAPIYTLDLSPSNIKAFDGAVAHVARSLNGPPIKAILTVVGKNVGTYATVAFVDPMPNPDYAAHAGRRAEVQDMLFRKPDFAAYEAKAQPTVRGRAPAKRSAARR